MKKIKCLFLLFFVFKFGISQEIEQHGPFLLTQWSQGNQNTPFCGEKRTSAGCSAVAVGQLLYYYYHPNYPIDLQGYYKLKCGNEKPEILNFTINDKNILPASEEGTPPSNEGISEFLFDIGRSINTTYLPTGGSSARLSESIVSAEKGERIIIKLSEDYHFDYNLMELIERDYSDSDDFKNRIIEELIACRPVLFQGIDKIFYFSFPANEYIDKKTGHAFIIDGYKHENGVDSFHMNFGWAGLHDNWYTLDDISPTSDWNFAHYQKALVGLIPHSIDPNDACNLYGNQNRSTTPITQTNSNLFENTNVLLNCPQITFPNSNQLSNNRINLEWTDVANSIGYYITIKDLNTNITIVDTETYGGYDMFRLDAHYPPNSNIEVEISPYDQNGTITNCSTFNFQSAPEPCATTLTSISKQCINDGTDYIINVEFEGLDVPHDLYADWDGQTLHSLPNVRPGTYQMGPFNINQDVAIIVEDQANPFNCFDVEVILHPLIRTNCLPIQCPEPTVYLASPNTATTYPPNTNIPLTWNGYGGTNDCNIAQYEYAISTNSSFSASTTTSSFTSNTSVTLEGVSSSGTVYWRVRAKNGNNEWSNWSSSRYFTIAENSSTCNPPSNLAATNITDNAVNLSWSDANVGTSAISYRVESSTNNSNWNLVSGFGNINNTSVTITGLSSCTSYYYRIKSNCSGSPSTTLNASNVVLVTTTNCNSGGSGSSLTLSDICISARSDDNIFCIGGDDINGTFRLKNYNNDYWSGQYQVMIGNSFNYNACVPITLNTNLILSPNQDKYISYSGTLPTSFGVGTYKIIVFTREVNGDFIPVMDVAGSCFINYKTISIESCSGGGGNGNGICLPPSQPFVYSYGVSTVNLGWNSISGAVSYNVQWREVGGDIQTISNVAGNTYELTDLTESTEYEFRVQTNCSSSSSDFDNTFYGFSTTSNNAIFDNVFEKTYEFSSAFKSSNIIETIDENFLVGGLHNNAASIVKLSTKGNVLWAKQLNIQSPGKVIENSIGELFIIGKTSGGFVVVKMNNLGDIIEAVKIEGDHQDLNFTITPEDELIVLTNYLNRKYLFALKFDNSLNILWSKQYGASSAKLIPSGIFLSETDLYMTGCYIISSEQKILYLRLNTSNGNIQQGYWYGNTMDAAGVSIYLDGNIPFIIGRRGDDTNAQILLTRFKSSETEDWTKAINTSFPSYIETSIHYNTDFFIAGFFNTSSEKKGLVSRISQSANVNWSHQYDFPNDYDDNGFNDIIETSDERLMLLGTLAPSNRYMTLFKINPSYGLICEPTGITLESQSISYTGQSGIPETTLNLPISAFTATLTDLQVTETLVCGCETTANFSTSNEQICQGETLTFDYTGTNASNFSWTIGDGTTSFSTNMSADYTFNEAGTFPITLIATEGDCEDQTTILITVNPLPTIFDVNLVDETCDNANGSISFQITNGTTPYTINWSTSDTDITNLNDLSAGDYWVDVTDENNCAINRTHFTINNNNDSPDCLVCATVSITNTNTICNGSNYNIEVTISGDNDALFDLNAGTYGTSFNAVPSGTYTIEDIPNGQDVTIFIQEEGLENSCFISQLISAPDCPTCPSISITSIMPDDGTTLSVGDDYTLSWTIDGSDNFCLNEYQLQLDNEAFFVDASNYYSENSSISLTAQNVGTLYWRVRAKNNNDIWGNWSATHSIFIENAVEDCPTPSNPSSSFIENTSAYVGWDNVNGDGFYKIEWGTTGQYTSSNETSNDYYYLTNLSPGTTYNWRVSSICDNDFSLTVGASFTTLNANQENIQGDLTIQSEDVTPYQDLCRGQEVTIDCLHRYYGTNTSPNPVKIGYFLSTDDSFSADDILLGTTISNLSSASSINPGVDTESEEITVNLPIIEDNEMYIIFYSDYEDNFIETDEGNNIEIVSIFFNCDGCTWEHAHNYDPSATDNDGSCETCFDNIQNGDETGVDCGGVRCAPCGADCNAYEFLIHDNITSNQARLNWSASGNANNYTVYYKEQSASVYNDIYTVSTSTTLNGLTPNTTYCWYVRTNCSTELVVSAEQCFTTEQGVFGCTNSSAHNYDPSATDNDGSCETCFDNIQNGDETAIDCGGTLCDPCNTAENTLIADVYSILPNETVNFTYQLATLESADELHFGDGTVQSLSEISGSFSHSYEHESVYTASLRLNGDIVEYIRIQVKSCEWISYVTSTNSYREANEDICATVQNDIIHLAPNLSNQSYYWSNHRNIKDFNLSGDDMVLEARVKNPNSEGGISCYDTRIGIFGSVKNAHVAYMTTGCSQYASINAGETTASGSNTSLTALGQDLSAWHIIRLEVKDGIVSTYYDGELKYIMNYEGTVGNTLGVYAYFKGAGSVDWIKLYDASSNTVVYEENFDDCNYTCGCSESTMTISDNPISSNTYQVTDDLFSDGTVSEGNVTFKAGNSITLLENFEVALGAEFAALIEGCSSSLINVDDSFSDLQPRIIPQTLDFKIQPNPFSHKTTLILDIPVNQSFNIFISDFTGKQISQLAQSVLSEERNYQFQFNGEQLPNGIYWVTLQVDNQQITKKMVLLK